MSKKIKFLFFIMFVAMAGMFADGGKAAKAGTVTPLEDINEGYQITKNVGKFDITNDGVADEIEVRVQVKNGYFKKYSITINGGKAYNGKIKYSALDIHTKYLYVNEKESYLNVTAYSDNHCCESCILLKYTAGKLRKVKSFSIRHKWWATYESGIVQVSENKMVYETTIQPAATGYITYNINYKKTNGKWVNNSSAYLVKSGNYGEGNNIYISAKKISLYKKSSCIGSSYKISAGKKCKLLKVKVPMKGGKYEAGLFKCGNKKGWILIGDYDNYGIFKNVRLVA